MRIILAILAALAAVTFPVYFVVFIFKSLMLGIMTLVVAAMWVISQAVLKFSKRRTSDVKLIGR